MDKHTVAQSSNKISLSNKEEETIGRNYSTDEFKRIKLSVTKSLCLV
jgi:hypothetical protein